MRIKVGQNEERDAVLEFQFSLDGLKQAEVSGYFLDGDKEELTNENIKEALECYRHDITCEYEDWLAGYADYEPDEVGLAKAWKEDNWPIKESK